ncbi:MAG: SDR family NAD(P)-dependent oxidoreductase [Flavobacteriales bacterium]|nr:SDR family NAD(P)-dependent oxidoreductase [Flavobacteriales bacterium]
MRMKVNDRWALITGANSGLGLASARLLAAHGLNIIMACRSQRDGEIAVARSPRSIQAQLHVRELDLADLATVRPFMQKVSALTDKLHVLVNNAGVMEPPWSVTAQGHELQFGVNHLGHFLLTMTSMPLFDRTQGARILTVSSLAAEHGQLDVPYRVAAHSYDRAACYRASKLANLLFALELDRRLRRTDPSIRSLAMHPGYVRTRLQRHVRGPLRQVHSWLTRSLKAQPATNAATIVLEAATDPSLQGGAYLAPSGPGELSGAPVVRPMPKVALDEAKAMELWAYSEEITIPFMRS